MSTHKNIGENWPKWATYSNAVDLTVYNWSLNVKYESVIAIFNKLSNLSFFIPCIVDLLVGNKRSSIILLVSSTGTFVNTLSTSTHTNFVLQLSALYLIIVANSKTSVITKSADTCGSNNGTKKFAKL